MHSMKNMGLVGNALLFLVAFMSSERVYGQDYKNAFNLRSDVLTGYDKTIRPLLNLVDIVHVNVTYDIGGIQEINEMDGSVRVLMQFEYTWIDERIRWNPADYNNTYTILLPKDSVWKPEIVAVGDPGKFLDSSVTNVRYFPSGHAGLWYPMNIVSTGCIINIEYYPFDTQKCAFWFLLADYFNTEVQLHAVNVEPPLRYYLDSPIWNLTKAKASANALVLYAVNLTVTRKPTFIIIIVIIPIMLLSLMSIMVFLLPPDSGERMSYSITLLLALMVFLTIVSDNLPKTSSPLPILSYFIGLHVLLSALITFATILNLRLFYKDEHEPVPSWLCNCCRKRGGGQQCTTEGYLETTKEPASSRGPFSSNGIHLRANLSIPNGTNSRVHESTSYGRYQAENNRQLHRSPGYDQQGTRTTGEAKTEITWKDVSRIADWIMFIVTVVYFVVVFIVFVIIIILKS